MAMVVTTGAAEAATPAAAAVVAAAVVAAAVAEGADGGRPQLLRNSTAFSNGRAAKIGRHSPETCSAAAAFGITRGSLTENVRP